MIPGNVDPRRPDKVQRYKPATSGNGNAPGEDLTPDYMNILGPDSTTGNVQADNKVSEPKKAAEAKPQSNQQPQPPQPAHDDASKPKPEATSSTNAIPTSPQYGVAVISTTNDIPAEAATPATDTITESTPKITEIESKDLHSTPSKNDRFKVVKIASSEPFRRGRWKCMDYVDQVPSVTQAKTAQGITTSVQLPGGVYLQTQSLPPHQIQQLLLQGALAAATQPQFYQGNMQSQVVPQTQYFYQPVQGQGGGVQQQQQIMNQGVVPATNSVQQPQFINPAAQQHYFQPNVMQQNYQNLQFMQQQQQQQPAYQNQNSAFVPTTQNLQSLQNFQQAQTYAGQPNVTQQSVVSTQQAQAIPATQPQSQPMVNGFAYSPQNITEQQIAANNLPTQVAKNVILNSNSNPPPPQQQQLQQQLQQPPVNQVVQNQVVQNQPIQQESQQPVTQNSIVARTGGIPMQNQHLPDQNHQLQTYQQIPHQNMNPVMLQNMNQMQNVVVLQTYEPIQATDVYTNPQFVASVHSLPIMEQGDPQAQEGVIEVAVEAVGNPDDSSKTNPVNAIDNKIEQAMDLVKSHLMYTVREEVEVLKEKIAELMERIQQLESENNYLRSQLPKNNPNSNGNSEPSPQQ